ncbi:MULTISPECIES: GNAT family N-acetyltransferase [unclassified Streptosporangium]|uniref:GNAT family N-acetyltransferase n=1 Tax=unclassified Streptosporangium TaxID=2632669 RepID=UPI002E2ABFD8|nr:MULTISPECIES: GNAT family N-acetyltransferase [unclassified Streptosporangium]
MLDPCRDPEPDGWEDFRQAEGLTPLWAYDVIGASCEGSWARPLLAVFREGRRITAVIGAVYIGLRSPGSSRAPRPRREPIILDVRLPGYSNGPTWHFSGEVSFEARCAMLRLFERAAARRLGWGLAGTVYRMMTEPESPMVVRRGAIVRDSPGSTVMPLSWTSAEEWIGSLSRNRRSVLRRQLRRMEKADDLIVTTGTVRSDLDPVELAEMNRRHTARLAARLDPRAPLPAAYFDRLLRREDVSVTTYHAGERLLAFAILFDHGTTPVFATWAALRPEDGGRKDLYFDAHARLVRKVIEDGKKELLGGRGLVEVKKSLGYEYVPMKLVAVPRWVMG